MRLSKQIFSEIQAHIDLAKARLGEHGLTLHVDNDMQAFVDYISRQEGTHGVPSSHDPHRCYLHPGNSFWVYVKHVATGDIVACQEVSSCPDHPGLLGAGYRRLRGAEILVRPSLHLDEDDASIVIDHDQVNFAAHAGKIPSECFESFAFEELLAAFFAPSAERLSVRRQFALVRQKISYPESRVSSLAIWRQCGRCAAVPA